MRLPASWTDPITYGFAVGRVRVLETRLLGRGTFERLLDAADFADRKRVLSETHFGRYLEPAVTAHDVERAVDASLADLYEDFLEAAGLPAPVVAFFRTPYDFANLKGAVKPVILGARPESATPLGSVPAESFGHPRELPGRLGELAREVLDADQPPSAEAIDSLIDRAMFDELRRLAAASRIPFLTTLAARQADMANVKVLLRSALLGRRPEEVAAMVVEGGTLRLDTLLPLLRRPAAELAEALLETRVVRASSAAGLLDMRLLDIACDDAVLELMRIARRAGNGPRPVLAYVLARQAEALTVRAVLVGGLAGLGRDELRSRLREAFA